MEFVRLKRIISVFLLAGFVSAQVNSLMGMEIRGVQVSRDWKKWAELATAFLQGTCSKVDFSLKEDDSKGARVKRLMISGIRCLHHCLVFTNHGNENLSFWGNNANCVRIDHTALGICDGIGLLLRVKNLFDSSLSSTQNDDQAEESEGQESGQKSGDTEQDQLPELAQLGEAIDLSYIPAEKRDFYERLVKQGEFVRKVLLPELERFCALFIAGSKLVDDGHNRWIGGRAMASGILVLSRLCQWYLDSKDGSSLKALLRIGLFLKIVDISLRLFFLRRGDVILNNDGGSGDGSDKYLTCSICKEAFIKSREVVATPCDHMFCRPCVLRWIEGGHNACPICRGNLPNEGALRAIRT